MGNAPKEEKERNIEIAHDFELFQIGLVSMVDLVAKWRMSSARIYQIGQKYLKKENE